MLRLEASGPSGGGWSKPRRETMMPTGLMCIPRFIQLIGLNSISSGADVCPPTPTTTNKQELDPGQPMN